MSIASDYVEQISDLEPSDDPRDEIIDYGEYQDAEQVEHEVRDSLKWSSVYRDVFRCTDGSHFAVVMHLPATENQEGQDFNAKAELVEPREVTVTRYVAVKAGA